VRRLASFSSHLDLLARKLAFSMHSQNRTRIHRENASRIAVEALAQELPPTGPFGALEEVGGPVQRPASHSGDELSFGHLRYQEHLAAKEIVSNRGIEIISLIRSDWWRGVFQLFAQMNQDTATMVRRLRDTGLLTSVADSVLEHGSRCT